MLKFLTHKLRTHSLNEENVSEKVEERDSGTESDDEADRADTGDFCTDVIMKWNDVTDISMSGGSCACGRAPSPPLSAPHAPPQPHHHPHPDHHHHPHPDHLYDHHSSEEELEVINGAPSAVRLASGAGAGAEGGAEGGAGEAARKGARERAGGAAPVAESRRRGASSPPPAHPEKRKWPAQPYHHHHHSTDIHADLETDDLAARPASDDDDDTKIETPVRFRTSPPLEALKVRGGGAGAGGGGGGAGCSCAPSSPRRRRLPLPPPRRHRPALDFDKMQQLKVGGGGVRSWRAVGGAHGGELSVFCW